MFQTKELKDITEIISDKYKESLLMEDLVQVHHYEELLRTFIRLVK